MKMKKILALFLSAVMAVALFSACQLSDNDTSAPETTAAPDGAAAPDATDGQGSSYLDLTAAVAKINGETVLTLGDVKTLFDMYVEYFQAYGYDVTGDTATLEGFQDDLVDMLVRDKLVEVKARELGYSNYTDEQKADFIRLLKAEPRRFIAQEVIDFCDLDILEKEGRVPRKADLRAFVLTSEEPVVWKSGLTRFSRNPDSFIVNSSQGGGFKDTWVLSR